MQSATKSQAVTVLDLNNNFSATAAFSNANDNATRPSTSARPRTPKDRKGIRRPSTPYALDFLSSLRRENSLPFRFYGLDIADTVKTNYPFVYRINDGVSNNTILQEVCQERGWVEFKDPVQLSQRDRDIHDDVGWNMWWSYNFYQGSPFRSLRVWQFTNHNPRAFQFCNKSYLSSFLRKMVHEYGDTFDFSPKSFIMPDDYGRFMSEHIRRKQENCSVSESRNVITIPATEDPTVPSRPGSWKTQRDTKSPVWISKPIGKSQGKGIYLTTDAQILATESRSVVQEYISRPHLIGGYKWDIRIYVCVASTDPLVIYMYREGLCRFATEKYDLTNLQANFSHLTNASLNKFGPDYPTDKEIVGSGCKWSLKQLRKHFKDRGICDWYMWQRIMSMVVLTVVGEALRSGFSYPANKNCFDFFGFDILIDETLRPWLLEVNYSPGLGGDCDVDEIVKKPMLHSLFDLLKLPKKTDPPTYIKTSVNNDTVIAYKSKLMQNIDKYLRRPLPQAPAPEHLQKPVDVTCQGRLKEAQAIYSQNLVADMIEKYSSRNPGFKMTRSMKAIVNRNKTDKKKILKKTASVGVPDNEPPSSPEMPPLENSDDSSVSKSDEESQITNQTDETVSKSEVDSEDKRPSSPTSSSKKPDATEEPYLYIKRQDWMNPPKIKGDWVLVYPCKAFPYQSPYRSSISDLRGIVKTVDNYLQIAKFVLKAYPGQTDDLYRDKMKSLCRWDIDLWIPPEEVANDDLVDYLR